MGITIHKISWLSSPYINNIGLAEPWEVPQQAYWLIDMNGFSVAGLLRPNQKVPVKEARRDLGRMHISNSKDIVAESCI
jgi:hypothetical protein